MKCESAVTKCQPRQAAQPCGLPLVSSLSHWRLPCRAKDAREGRAATVACGRVLRGGALRAADLPTSDPPVGMDKRYVSAQLHRQALLPVPGLPLATDKARGRHCNKLWRASRREESV